MGELTPDSSGKTCPDCGAWKPFGDFPKNAGRRDGQGAMVEAQGNVRDDIDVLNGLVRYLQLHSIPQLGVEVVDAGSKAVVFELADYVHRRPA